MLMVATRSREDIGFRGGEDTGFRGRENTDNRPAVKFVEDARPVCKLMPRGPVFMCGGRRVDQYTFIMLFFYRLLYF